MKNLFIFLIFLNTTILMSQENNTLIMIAGDSIPTKSIGLEEIIVFPPLVFSNYKDEFKYYTVKRKTLKVYPYAILASKRLKKLNKRLTLIKGKANKKK
ncbi:DUF4294 domain-containing protein, partial [Flavobacteriaceae bacterium]|nr:DUF4294 domain-containing protein [Flavobacteriaceae bacterium]